MRPSAFNATDVVEACIATCKRGVEVTLWLDLGFNDQGEMIPRQVADAFSMLRADLTGARMQGGTNEDVVKHLYAELHKAGAADKLLVY